MSYSPISAILNNDVELDSFLVSSLKSWSSAPGIRTGKFFILTGSGANGKTTLLNILSSSQNSIALSFDFLTSETPFPRMPYSGATPIPTNKIVVFHEGEYDTEGEDDTEGEEDTPIVAARLYDFLNAGNLVFYACNELPVLKGTNPDLWNNIHVIHCLNQFSGNSWRAFSEAEMVSFRQQLWNRIATSPLTSQHVPEIVTYWTNQVKSRCLEWETLPTFAKSVADGIASAVTDPHSVAASDSEVSTKSWGVSTKPWGVSTKSGGAIATADNVTADTPTATATAAATPLAKAKAHAHGSMANIAIVLERDANMQEVLKIMPDPDSDGFIITYVTPRNRNETMYITDDDTLESFIEAFFEFLNYEEAYSRIGFHLPMMPDVWMPASRALHYIKTLFPQQLELLMLDWPVLVD